MTAPATRHHLYDNTRHLLALVPGAYSSSMTLKYAQTVRHHYIQTTESSQNWMSNDSVTDIFEYRTDFDNFTTLLDLKSVHEHSESLKLVDFEILRSVERIESV